MRWLSISLLLLLFVALPSVSTAATILTPDQELWLLKHKKTIIVRPEKNYPPFSFVSSTPNAKPKGLAVDYLELIARKVSAYPTYLEAKSLPLILGDIKQGKESVVLVVSENDERSEYLYFSEPYIAIPAVIVVRKDYKHSSKELTLADFNGKQVAIAEGDTVHDYVVGNYQKIIIESVSDNEVALQKLLLGEVDAAVMDLASLSYYTSHDMLSYVTIAGQTGFDYTLSFGVPKTMPELQAILNAGMKEITPSEKAIIKDRWITFPEGEKSGEKNLPFALGAPVWVGLSIGATIIIIFLLISIIVHTRRHHRIHLATLERSKEKKEHLQALSAQLGDLEEASEELAQNMAEIKALEKDIQGKIAEIKD